MITRALITSALLTIPMAWVTPLHAALVIYEGFDYTAGNLAGSNGGTGFTGSWTNVKDDPQVTSSGLSWGSLAVTGNSATRTTSGGGGTRDIGATSALDSAGLMGNGDTLWFSFIVNKPTTGNANVDFNFSLGTDGFADYGSGEFGQRTKLDSGEGIGFSLTNRNDTQMDVEGAYWQDDGGGGFSERNLNEASNRWSGPTMLVVGRIDWGANGTADESLTLYTPDTDLNQGAARLTWANIPALDQSAFDTIAFQLKGGGNIDEIRFGSSYADVTPVPEPSALILGALGSLILLRRRR